MRHPVDQASRDLPERGRGILAFARKEHQRVAETYRDLPERGAGIPPFARK